MNTFAKRIRACACIVAADKAEKIKGIADARKVSIEDASAMYVWGALKASVRRGTAKTMADALERFESGQVGDRSVSVHGEAPINKEVRRINAINETRGSKGTTHARNMGVVLGKLYVELDERMLDSAVDVVLEQEGIEHAILDTQNMVAGYIADYVTRLSKTAKASIRRIVASKLSTEAIMAAKDNEATLLKERAKYLRHNFPAQDVSTREYIELVRKYA